MSIIHRIILNRLLAAWVIVSLATSAGVFYVGIEKVDDQLVELAVQESAKLSSASLPLLNQSGTSGSTLDHMAAEFVRQHFIVVELYDKNRRKVSAAINPAHARIKDELRGHAHSFPVDDERHYEKFMVGGQPVLRVLLPLKDAQGAVVGYFEGIFLIDPETVARLRRDMIVTLVVVLVAVTLTTICLYPVILSLNRDVLRYSHDLLRGNLELMEVLGSAIAKRDSDTNIHNYRVSIYAVRLAEAVGLSHAEISDLIAGAFLHDVGKIGISDSILLKPGKLDEQEFAVMRTHVALGVEILRKSDWLQRARDVVEYHHEKFDGSGYLKGLVGEAIPVTARIFAVVDVFDALTSRRPYKEPFPFAEAMAILHQGAGSHFDPRLIEAFAGIAEPLYREISDAPDDAVEARLQVLIGSYLFAANL
jgi:putative nucleotidyltransferase with HDIG domain